MKLIHGVAVKPIKRMADERGMLMEIMRSDDPIFRKFGQVYLTMAYPGVVKAWHYHRKQTDHFCVVSGMAKVVLYDARPKSPTYRRINEFFAGELNPQLIVIPPRVMHGYKAISTAPAYLINVPTELFNYSKPDEFRVPPHTRKIPYNWSRRDG
jgi:dTDP-4-dehydrorhamnose 3,5-epimerase